MTLSDALSVFSDHLDDIKEAAADNASYRLTLMAPVPRVTDPVAAELWRDLLQLEVAAIVTPSKLIIERIVARQQHTGTTRTLGVSVTPEHYERAREYPIQELFTSLVGTPIRHGMASCPWHKDKNASFSMRRYNRYRCFSCGEKGSVIDLYMKLNGCDVKTAVKSLLNI